MVVQETFRTEMKKYPDKSYEYTNERSFRRMSCIQPKEEPESDSTCVKIEDKDKPSSIINQWFSREYQVLFGVRCDVVKTGSFFQTCGIY